MNYEELKNEVREVAGRFSGLVKSAPDGERQIKGLEWTVAELAAHVVTVARRNLDVARGGALVWDFDLTHEGTATVNARDIAQLDVWDLTTLAQLIVDENARVLTAYGDDPDRSVHWPRYGSTTSRSLALWLGELLIHGLDLSRTLGVPWPIGDTQARSVFSGAVPALSALANRSVAARVPGTYHIHLRGGEDYAIDVDPDADVAVTEGKPRRADLHVNANPRAYLLVGYGRVGPWSSLARGEVIAWGRKPWRAFEFAQLFEQP